MENKKEEETLMNPFANNSSSREMRFKEIITGDFRFSFKVNHDEYAFLSEWANSIDAMVNKKLITPVMTKRTLKDKIDFTFKEGDARSTYNFLKSALNRDNKLENIGFEYENILEFGIPAIVERRLPSDAIIIPVSASDLLRKELEFPDDEDDKISSIIARRIHELEKKNMNEYKIGYHSNILLITPELIQKLNTIKDLKNNIVTILGDTILKKIDNLSLMTSSALDKIYMEYVRIKSRVQFMLRHDEFIDDVKYVLEFMGYTNLMLIKNLYVLKDDEILISKEAREERTNYYTILLKTLIDSIDNYLVLSNVYSNLIENTVYGNNDIDARMLESLEIREVKIPKDKPRYEENKRQLLRRQFGGKR